jgi:gamma-glutamyl-gamma-aminobutyraldehyde dehydrogenase
VGRQLHQYAAQSNLKRLYLELGGKSPNIVFADAPDLDVAARAAVNGMFRNSGQVCISGTRLLVQESIAGEFIEKLLAYVRKLRVGDPLDLGSNVGAVASVSQLEQDLAYVDKAQRDGARLLTGGERLHVDSGGYYMQPTVFDKVTPDMTIAREEVFGPVLSVMTFKDEAEAVAIANATIYGLAAGIWTADLGTAHRMIKRVKSGLIHVNCYGGSDLTVPLGGVKQSGNGHDKSLHAMEKYMDLKSAWIQL